MITNPWFRREGSGVSYRSFGGGKFPIAKKKNEEN